MQTGELAYKPVLWTTIGQPVALVTVKAGGGRDPLHGWARLLGAALAGWTHARKLDSQTRVHGVADSVVVDSVHIGPKEKTYNLVVADWNTYFVGRGKLLVHDVTLPGPTTTEVPGLKMP